LLEEPQLHGKEDAITHLVLCSGRIYFDLTGNELRSESRHAAIIRVEQLYPFPRQALENLLHFYPLVEKVIWAQEEPLNMGAWSYIHPRLKQVLGDRLPLYYVGRPESSSPAEGSSTLYRLNQQILIDHVFKVELPTSIQSVMIERG
jgi:2-oxoglutarate dehydrogenase E1 component